MGDLVEVTGDMFAGADDAIGHGCNIDGVMGAGVAKIVRRQWPELYTGYRWRCLHGKFPTGGFWAYEAEATGTQPGRVVYNLASQDRPGRHASLRWVEESMRHALRDAEKRGVVTFGIPRIGCGIGGLNWDDVRPVLACMAENTTVTLTVYTL